MNQAHHTHAMQQVLFESTKNKGAATEHHSVAAQHYAVAAQYNGPNFKAYFSPDELAVLTPTPLATKIE